MQEINYKGLSSRRQTDLLYAGGTESRKERTIRDYFWQENMSLAPCFTITS